VKDLRINARLPVGHVPDPLVFRSGHRFAYRVVVGLAAKDRMYVHISAAVKVFAAAVPEADRVCFP